MLPKKYRFPIQDASSQKATVKRSPYFTFKIFSSGLTHGRFAVTISKKVSPLATQRNRIRRIIFNGVQPLIPSRAGSDTQIIVSPAVSALISKDAIIEELLKAI